MTNPDDADALLPSTDNVGPMSSPTETPFGNRAYPYSMVCSPCHCSFPGSTPMIT